MKPYIANSKSQDLRLHLVGVSELAMHLARNILRRPTPAIEAACSVAGLYHDVGKTDIEFQDFIWNIVDGQGELNEEKTSKYFHNEISLAIFDTLERNNYSFNVELDRRSTATALELARYAIYWHHPERKGFEFEDVGDIDLSANTPRILEFLKTFDDQIDDNTFIKPANGTFPKFIENPNQMFKDNSQKLFVLMVLNAADSIISKLPQTELAALISNKNYADYIKSYTSYSEYVRPVDGVDLDRLLKQEEIAIESLKHRTVQVNAPTAFGKTFVMFLRALFSGKRTYIVCPRNIIAESIFDEFIELAGKFNQALDIELYFGSKRQKSSVANTAEPFESRIVITNIDNYLKAFNNSDVYYKNYPIVDADLIIDEFHELISDAPMYSIILDVLRMRHFYLKDSKTLLVSATPSLFAELINDDVTYLPEKGKHYQSANNKPYNLKAGVDAPHVLNGGEICILNSIKNVQSFAKIHNIRNVIHSMYIKNDIERIKGNFIRVFGKHGEVYGVNQEKSVASLILQSSLNISFRGMYESCLSPENTMQRLGRCSRFGEYDLPEFTSFITKDLGESAVSKNLYDFTLRGLWYAHYANVVGANPNMTLDELYLVYNEFNEKNRNRILTYLEKLYRNGIEDYHKYELQPRRHSLREGDFMKEGVKTFGGIRDPLAGYFIAPSAGTTYKAHQIGETDSMNIAHHVFMEHWNNAGLQLRNDESWEKEIRKLVAVGYRRWLDILEDYKKFKKKSKSKKMFFSKEFLLNTAKWSETPLPGIDYEYDERLGLRDTARKSIM